MKKLLLLSALLWMTTAVNAQLNGIYIDDGIELSGSQWHFGNYSVIEANNSNYLVISPDGYCYRKLAAFVPERFEAAFGMRPQRYRPYVYGDYLGWYIEAGNKIYFNFPDGHIIELRTILPFHNYYYHIKGLHYLNLRNWHWRHNYRPFRPNGYYYDFNPPRRYKPAKPGHNRHMDRPGRPPRQRGDGKKHEERQRRNHRDSRRR